MKFGDKTKIKIRNGMKIENEMEIDRGMWNWYAPLIETIIFCFGAEDEISAVYLE